MHCTGGFVFPEAEATTNNNTLYLFPFLLSTLDSRFSLFKPIFPKIKQTHLEIFESPLFAVRFLKQIASSPLVSSPMVQRMPSGHSKVKVKSEMDDPAARDNSGPPRKRPRFEISSQSNNLEAASGADGSSQMNESSPLGLRLKKSPSLLELIQMRLSQEQSSKSSSQTPKGSLTEKLKASNFPASLLIIGTWEYKSKYEGDLVAKCYFAKHKLVWEVLDGSLKNKIEIQWSDIVGIKANYAVEGTTDTLEVVLARQPLFFRETNPQPRKHTLWQPTSDFTTGQASIYRHHVLHCTQGLLARHFEKLTQCDPRLNFLSQKAEIVIDCPYFVQKTEPNRPYNNEEEGGPFFAVPVAESPSLKNESHDMLSAPAYNYSSSPSSVMETGGIEDVSSSIGRTGMTPSISMTDLVSHIGRFITGGGNPSSSTIPGANNDELNSSGVLEEISRYLLNDYSSSSFSNNNNNPLPDRQSLMCRVNSLYSLLQKDVQQNLTDDADEKEKEGDNPPPPPLAVGPVRKSSPTGWAAAMSRKDSFGDLLLLNLPRIASLPHILPVVSEEFEDKKR